MKLIEIQLQKFTYKGREYYCTQAETDSVLNVKVVHCVPVKNGVPQYGGELEIRGEEIKKINPRTLGAPYFPASELPAIETSVPDNMADDVTTAMQKLKKAVGGDVTNFVCERLQWSHRQISDYLLAEQVDAVALAIYNIESRKQAIIIGDQTGIGKGRMAASLIRYAYVHNKSAVFITEAPKLFSDIYRDLTDTGSAELVPLIIAESRKDDEGRDDAAIYETDANGKVLKTIYAPLPDKLRYDVLTHKKFVPYDYVLTTYSQFRAQTDPEKQKAKDRKGLLRYQFLLDTVKDGILILDEVHNASGSTTQQAKRNSDDLELKGSNTFVMISSAVQQASGVCFLSATFAKRPENMPLYTFRSCLKETGLKDIELVQAISKGGEALQEIISSSLVKEGQMVRREKTYDGIEVNYIYLDKEGHNNPKFQVPDLEQLHRSLSDNITNLMLQIVAFEKKYVAPAMAVMAESMAMYGEELNQNNQELGINHVEYFSRVSNIVGQMLLSVKAEAVADHAIRRLKEGKKIVIAVSHTSEAMLQDIMEESGILPDSGKPIRTDFSQGLLRGLKNTLKYSIKGEDGKSQGSAYLPLALLSEDGQKKYNELSAKILSTNTGVNCSPIDIIEQKLQKEGYAVSEITGRKYRVQFTDDSFSYGKILTRKPESKNAAVIKYQNNKIDVLVINTSGATGLSVHATNKGTSLSLDQVKPRCMIIAECELDISKEVQKRGRINRTGQLRNIPPSYDYLMSAIPAEKRNMMMLQKKLLSLDANTTSKQKQSTNIIDVPDFINKYGDIVVTQYLKDNAEINDRMNDPLDLYDEEKNQMKDVNTYTGAAKKVSGRVAMLKCTDQEDFYNTVYESYTQLVENLKQRGEYDLEVNEVPLNATLIGTTDIFTPQKSEGNSVFATPSYIGQYECDVLVKPFTRSEVEGMLQNFITENNNQDPQDVASQLAEELEHNALINKKLKEVEEMANYATKRTTIEKNDELTLEKKAEKLTEADKKHQGYLLKIEADCNKKLSRKNAIKYFYAGRQCWMWGDTRGICLGARIGKAKNKFTLSNIVIRFAVASSEKYIELNLSDNDFSSLSTILTKGEPNNNVLEMWQDLIKESSRNREMRRIVTGNILAAYPQVLDLISKEDNIDTAHFNLKLINFTLSNGGKEKGILLPRSNMDSIKTEYKARVPITDITSFYKKIVQNNESGNFEIVFSNGCYLKYNKLGNQVNEIYFFTPLDTSVYKGIANDKFWIDIDPNGRGCVNIGGKFKFALYRTISDINDQVFKILDYLDSKGLMVEVSNSELDKILSKKHTINEDANWKPLTVDTSKIPSNFTINKLFYNEIKLTNLKYKPLTNKVLKMNKEVLTKIKNATFPNTEEGKLLADSQRQIGIMTDDYTAPEKIPTESIDLTEAIKDAGLTVKEFETAVGNPKRSLADAVMFVASQVTGSATTTPQPSDDAAKAKRLKLAKAKIMIEKEKRLRLELEEKEK